MKIILSNHLRIRLAERKIPQSYPRKILEEPEDNFRDSETGHRIAVRGLKYGGKLRPMAVAYDIIGADLQVITVFPTSDREIENRTKSGRWIGDEKS